jgi:hypothetical protein
LQKNIEERFDCSYLSWQVSTTANSSDFDGGHSAGNIQIFAFVCGFHLDNAVRTLVAMKMAVTMLLAWALNPPIDPAIAEPTKFLLIFKSTRASTLVFKTYIDHKNKVRFEIKSFFKAMLT